MNNTTKIKRYMKYTLKVLVFLLPFVMGTVGYLWEGEKPWHAPYFSASLYLFSYTADSSNLLIEIARWTAPIVSVSGLMLVLKNTFGKIKDFLASLSGKAIAVYCGDEDWEVLKQELPRAVRSREVNPYAKEHVIMLEDDMANLNFYYGNKGALDKGKVYMQLEEIDSTLLSYSNIGYFNINELIARKYWKDRNLLKYMDRTPMKVKIAIVGFGKLGEKLLSVGLMNNIYQPEQAIEYHVWGETKLFRKMFENKDWMNGDSVTYHDSDWEEDIDSFESFDRIILATEVDLRLLQILLYTCHDSEIDYYNAGDALLQNVFTNDKLHAFGNAGDILTDGNIRGIEMERTAMEINYNYEANRAKAEGIPLDVSEKERDMKLFWERLDGFFKGGNIVPADYNEIRVMLLQKQGVDIDALLRAEGNDGEFSGLKQWLCKAEHIRWSRFYYLNHWELGKRDNARRKHDCLIPYEELSEEYCKKDWETIRVLLGMKS